MYNDNQCIKAAHYSFEVYDIDSDNSDVYDKSTNSYCKLYKHKDIHYIAFRALQGTQIDWANITDIKMYGLKEWEPGVKAHTDFINGYVNMRKKLKVLIEQNDIQELVVCGHSKGSVFANLFMYDLITKFKAPFKLSLYCFGVPKFCNKKFSNEIKWLIKYKDVNWFHYNHMHDVIPLLPFKFFSPYKQAGINITINNHGSKMKRRTRFHTIINFLFTRKFKYHNMNYYLDAMLIRFHQH